MPADRIVDLVRAGVAEVFALEVDSRAPQMIGESLGQHQRRRTPGISRKQVIEFTLKFRVMLSFLISRRKLFERMHQGFRNELPAVGPKVAPRVGHFVR